jgi:hypothetical protein
MSTHIENNSSSNSTEELRELVEKSIKLSQAVYEQNKKIKLRLTLIMLSGTLKWVLIIAPIVLGVIFLPPIVKDLLNQYNNLFGGANNLPVEQILKNISSEQLQGIDINQAIKILQK